MRPIKNTTSSEVSQIERMRHSCSHILAEAVLSIFPEAKLGIGPVIENGFYYDFELSKQLIPEDMIKIEEKMLEIKLANLPITQIFIQRDEANTMLLQRGQIYKSELLNEIPDNSVSFFKTGDNFIDLCRGPHVESTGMIGMFKLISIAGAYWKGDEKRIMLQRIYGISFETKDELDQFILKQEEAKKRDHRKLGRELGLFIFSDLVGSGLPLFTPKGTFVREQLANFSMSLQKNAGFEEVWIPHFAKIDLYKKSGHWDKFGKELFLVKSQETEEEFVMKPMNCPHHAQIYSSEIRSYKDLPIRYCENTTCYRDEKAGELSGLSRVRSLTQDDGHVFCRLDQIEKEFENIMNMIKILYNSLDMNFRCRLSFRDDNDKYLGNKDTWHKAEKILETVAKKLEINYYIASGEAAFYGPKIDIMVKDALGREHQCATEQLDFVQPSRFNLEYIDKDGQPKIPVMIHKALLGSIERFMSVYIEHTEGNFPLWLSYLQVEIIPINDKIISYAKVVEDELEKVGIRTHIDTRTETMQAKIRDAQVIKTPYMLIVGEKEKITNTISIRPRGGRDMGIMKIEEFIEKIIKEVQSKL